MPEKELNIFKSKTKEITATALISAAATIVLMCFITTSTISDYKARTEVCELNANKYTSLRDDYTSLKDETDKLHATNKILKEEYSDLLDKYNALEK